MPTTIIAKKDLFNNGKCFTKGESYTVNKEIHDNYELIETVVTNDLGGPHQIGGQWYKDFEIVDKNN